MKITWFADMTFRIQIAGRIVVTHVEGAPEGIDPTELVAGAQTVISARSSDLDAFDAVEWSPRRRPRLIDEEAGDEGLDLYRFGARGLVAYSVDEGLLVLEDAGAEAQWGRFADNGIAVLSGSGAQCAAHGTALLDIARPRLIALAIDDGEIDIAFDALVPNLSQTSLIVLEPRLAVEV
ncbi:hypothetical protein [Pelagibacterium halotolerans]|uniref:Uncharacterized protein n=1 Tax=Pelagibacterium halotolerans (strain DSM 22347 / JCM 15775 / CGMCC 1.7692 / B2) TaxID=1082931 RepID=G4RBB9_PELHB|nr:hypothetical protein [Pelagibacterium halotolerans]AEQ51617.1 hypothetical protein KKY_1600 [Pelagibacterium halotolerans B2]QJR18554.1 hypothetical protein HKM20_08980 [Pelagibacterium halotolerans]SEA18262.1 hypothetical protein SAMN05428936_102238 [Pelagibacterium halotolerans]